MRFFGGLLLLSGVAVMWYLGYKGLTFDQARLALLAFFKLPTPPGLAGAGSSPLAPAFAAGSPSNSKT